MIDMHNHREMQGYSYGDRQGRLWLSLGITTTSGWVTHRLGGFPKVGDSLTLGSFELKVEDMDGPRVARLTLSRVARPVT